MTRKEFIQELEKLQEDIKSGAIGWENHKILNFLESMERYTLDIDGYYENTNQGINGEEASWENFLNIIKGSGIYE